MPPYLLFRISCISFFIGVGLFPFFSFGLPLFYVYIGVLIGGFFLVFFWKRKTARVLLLIAVSFVFGIFRFGAAVEGSHKIQLTDQLKDMYFQGAIASEPRAYEKGQTFIVETTDPLRTHLLLMAPLFPRLFLGDIVSFQCRSIQYGTMNPLCFPRSMELVSAENKIGVTRILGRIKSSYLESVERWLPSPHAQLLSSILIGARSGFPRDLSGTFAAVGLSHIVAISGYNITVLIAFLASFMRRLPFSPKLRTPILMGGIALFTIFTGASAATVRAAIMGCALLIASTQGRRALGFQLLLGAAFLMVLYDPTILLNDRGFQLSCAATFGLFSIAPLLTQLLHRVSTFGGLRDIAIQTIAASLAALPFIVGYFGTFSFISFVTNLLVVPLIPILMAIGFFWSMMAYIASLIPPAFFLFTDYFVQIAALPVWAILDYMITIAEFFARVPFPALTSHSPIRTTIIIGCVYGAGIFVFLKIRKRICAH